MIYIVNIESFLQLVTLIIVFALVLGATWFTTRWIANYQKGAAGKGNIEVIEVRRLTNTKAIEIVRIGDAYYALALGKDEINLICKLDESELKFAEPQPMIKTDSFKELFEKVKKKQ